MLSYKVFLKISQITEVFVLCSSASVVVLKKQFYKKKKKNVSNEETTCGWMSKWCLQNNIGFIDNWMRFWGRPDLLKRDGVHPSWGGAAILSRNLAHSLRVHT